MRIFGHSRSPGEHPFEYLHNGYISAAKGAGEVQTRSLSKGSSRTYIFVNASKMSAAMGADYRRHIAEGTLPKELNVTQIPGDLLTMSTTVSDERASAILTWARTLVGWPQDNGIDLTTTPIEFHAA